MKCIAPVKRHSTRQGGTEPTYLFTTLMLLPEELLDIVVSYLAYRLEPQLSQPPELRPERVTSDILSLSLVNRQLRRICLPFLFLHIKNFEDAKQLGEQCSLKLLLVESAKYVLLCCLCSMVLIANPRTLILDSFQSRSEEGHKILCQSLPHIKHLSYVDITGSEITAALLSALCEHPSVSTILVRSTHDLPKGSTALDLSKVVIKGSGLINPGDTFLVPWLERGAKVSQLLIRKPELLTDDFGLRSFSGLSELDLLLGDIPVMVSWLPQFSSAHPYLKKIRFIDDYKHYFGHNTLPFISSFIEEVCNKQLCDAYSITRLAISRTTLSSTSVVSSQEWRVTGVTIVIKSSLIEILSLLHSSFPEIQTLEFRFEGNSTYHIVRISGLGFFYLLIGLRS